MADSTPKAVSDCHELILWIIPQIDKFPRVRRFTLGERLETVLLEVLEQMVEAAYSRQKETLLRHANVKLEVARHLWRMAWEFETVSTRRFEHGSRLMDDVGRQIGGWIRSRSVG